MQPGQMLAHYRIEEKIGAGGMGEVFKALDTKLERAVALKLLPSGFAADSDRLARFEREARTLASLQHTNVASIYGLENVDGQNFLIMELVEGEDLSLRIEQGALSVERVLDIAGQVATGLEAAHEKGIMHRDLKPANIKLGADGSVKILDFGLARAYEGEPEASESQSGSPTLTAAMTNPGVILGTAAYMSPEQARGKQLDKRTDIFSFGAVLYEMLTGSQPFSGETMSDTLASILKEQPDRDKIPEACPVALRHLVTRCLEKDPRKRLRDIGEARLILEAMQGGDESAVTVLGGVPATESAVDSVAGQTRASSWGTWVLAGLAVVAVAVAVFAFLRPAKETPLPLRKFEIAMDRADPSATVSFSPRISPDGRFLLYISQDQIWLRDLATTQARALPGTEDARDPFWSPDGEWIAYGTSNAIKKTDRSGGRSLTLANVSGQNSMGSGSSGVWNPDGSLFYTTGNTGILRLSSQAGEVAMHHAPQEGEVDFHEVCALPDGRGWVFVIHDQESFGQLGLLTADGQHKLVLSFPDDGLRAPVWSPSGHLLFQREEVAEGIWAVPFSLDRLEVTGEAFLVAAGGTRPSVSSDGTLVYSKGLGVKKLQLVWFNRQGQELGIIGDLQTTRPFPYLSPDESKVLVAATADDSRELWLFDTTGGAERRLTFDGLNWDSAIWHPDGNHLIGYTDPNYHSFLMTLDGSEPRQDLGPAILSCLGADGQEWIYSAPRLDRGFDFDLFSRPLGSPVEDGRELVSSPAIEWFPVLSPDGKYLLYSSNESGIDEVYATTYPGLTGRWQVSRDGGNWPAWRGDGKEIYFTTHRELFAVAVDYEGGFNLGRPQKLFDRPHTGWTPAWPDGFDVTADGQRFVMLRPVENESEERPKLVVVQNWFAEYSSE